MSLLKSSFSMCSLKGTRMESLAPDLKVSVERPYNSLSRMSRKTAEKDKWRRSWGSSSTSSKDDSKDFWDALKVHYNYIMDNELIDSCKDAGDDLRNECFSSPVHVWSLTELMNQYNELMSWLNTIQEVVYGEQEVLAEKSVRREQIAKLNTRAHKRELYNEQARQLKSKFPSMSDEISWRSSVLNTKWEVLEQVITPCKVSLPEPLALSSVEAEIRSLKKWIRKTERTLEPLKFSRSLGLQELAKKAAECEFVHNDIKSREKAVSGVVKLCDRLATDCTAVKFCNTDSFKKSAVNIQKRWHALYLKSLEAQLLLEQLIKDTSIVDDSPYDHDPEDEPVRKRPRFTGEFDEQSNFLCGNAGGFLNSLKSEQTFGDHQFECDVNLKGKTFPLDKMACRNTNDIGVMVGRTGLEQLKKCCRNLETVQDVGYSSESSTQLSTDEKCDSIKVYSFDSGEKVLSLVQSTEEACISESIASEDKGFSNEGNLDVSGVSHLQNGLSEGEKKRKPGTSRLLEEVRPGPNIGTFNFRHIDTESEAESTQLRSVEKEPVRKAKTRLDFHNIGQDQTTTGAGMRHENDSDTTSNPYSLLGCSTIPNVRLTEHDEIPMVDEVSSHHSGCHSTSDPILSRVNAEKSSRVSEWLSKSQISDSCDASGECTTDASDEVSGTSDGEDISKSNSGRTDVEVVKRRRIKSIRRPLSELRLQIQKCPGGTRSLPENELLSYSELWDHDRSLLSFERREDDFVQSKVSNNESSSENPIYGKYLGDRVKSSSRRRHSRTKGISKSSSFPGSGSGSRKNSAMSSDTCQSETHCYNSDNTSYTTDKEATIIPSNKSLNRDKESDIVSSQVEVMSSVSEQAWDPYLEAPSMSDSYEEPLDHETATRILSFGDDYRSFIDSQSDGTSSFSREPTPRKSTTKFTKLLNHPNTASGAWDSDSDMEDFQSILQDSRKQLLDCQLRVTDSVSVNNQQEMQELICIFQENIRLLKMVLQSFPGNHTSRKDVVPLLQAWRDLLNRAMLHSAQSSELQELQEGLTNIKSKLMGLKDQLDQAACRTKLTNPSDILLLIKNVNTCLQDLKDQKQILMQVNLNVHNFMIKTGSNQTSFKDNIAGSYKLWDDIYHRGHQELMDLETLSSNWEKYKATYDDFLLSLQKDRQVLDVLTVSLNLVEKQDDPVSAIQADMYPTLIDQARLLGSTQDLKFDMAGSLELSDREYKMSVLKGLADDLVTSLPSKSPLGTSVLKMNEQVGTEFRGLQQECNTLLNKSAITCDARFSDLKEKPTDWTDLSCNEVKGGEVVRPKAVEGRSWFGRLARVALPLQIAFVVVFCLAFLMEPNCCENLNNFHMSLSPGLRYSCGPPPI